MRLENSRCCRRPKKEKAARDRRTALAQTITKTLRGRGRALARRTVTDEPEASEAEKQHGPGRRLRNAADMREKADSVVVGFIAADRRILGEDDLIKRSAQVVEIDKRVGLGAIASLKRRIWISIIGTARAEFGDYVGRGQGA
jgi:hypothetical protein